MSSTTIAGLNRNQWYEKLAALAAHLKSPATLCAIGSGTSILAGQINRVCFGFDFLADASSFDQADLTQAAEKAGLAFNPPNELKASGPYLQFLNKGIAQLGRFTTESNIYTEGLLVVSTPPPANIVASMLVRYDTKDIECIAYIVNHFRVHKGDVVKVLRSFPKTKRAAASGNLEIFDVIAPMGGVPPADPQFFRIRGPITPDIEPGLRAIALRLSREKSGAST